MRDPDLKLDERDLKILAILQQEGRITKTELAERVNLSPTPCWSRLKRLEKIGLIEGYRAKIALKRFGLTLVFMEAELESHRAADFARFEAEMRRIPEVTGCWSVGGGIDYLIQFMVKDVDATHAWLVGRGAKVAMPPTDFGRLARIMFVTDPDGNYIEFGGPIKAPK